MSLNSKLAAFRKDQADATTRNISHARPSSGAPARVSTPQPAAAAAEPNKRAHEAGFIQPLVGGSGRELMTQVMHAIEYMKKRSPEVFSFDSLISYLSLPVDAEKNKPFIKQGLQNDARVEFTPKAHSGIGKDSYKYRPKHPVTSADELKTYLARQTDARGIPVRELKDGWPDCVQAINKLEEEGSILVTRNKKDNIPKVVWHDSPAFHMHIDDDFRDYWLKTKLPATEGEIRTELEKAGITPTSQIKETKKLDMKKKDRKRPTRRGGKTTNHHMLGILKDYNRR